MELRINNLSKSYPGGVQALQDVTLTIEPGMFGLIGPNGAGKSTLMRIIATLQEADTGTVILGDIDVLEEKDKVRQVLGYLPQEFGVYPKVSAEEMLRHLAVLKGIADRRQRRETVAAILQQTNLYEHRRQSLGSFSGGMKQRFGIAQALLGNPKLIIMDEPTAGLDPEERVRFHNMLSEIGENIIIILSTHIVDDVSELCSKMAILHEGQMLLTGDPSTLIESTEGKIWKRFIEKADFAHYEERYRVISTRLLSGKTLIHVFSEDRPDKSFEPSPPDLKDVYFSTIKADQSVMADLAGNG